jgi:hypothetical protein
MVRHLTVRARSRRSETCARHPASFWTAGGGLQAFWRLDELAGNLAAVERLNQRVAHELGGDHCHNIDRLMRLPGTVNFPNQLKRNKGRVPALASIVIEDNGEVTEAESLDAVLPQLPAHHEAERVNVVLAGVSPSGLQDMGITAADPLFPMITTPALDRSKALLRVVSSLVRRGRSDEDIAGLLSQSRTRHFRSLLRSTEPDAACAARAWARRMRTMRRPR